MAEAYMLVRGKKQKEGRSSSMGGGTSMTLPAQMFIDDGRP